MSRAWRLVSHGRPARRWGGRGPVALGAACLLLLSGCLSGPGGFEHDPLVGGPPIPPPSRPAAGAVAGAGVPASPAASSATLSPYPSPTSPAALASRTAGAGGAVPPPTARLGGPLPVPDDRLVPQPAPAATPGGLALTSGVAGPFGYNYEQLQAMLAARGVTMQHLQTVGDRGEWKFSCAVPNRKEPGLRRVYEATASGSSGLSAIKAVLDKIDEVQGPPGS